MKRTVDYFSRFIDTYFTYPILRFLHEVFMKVLVLSGAIPGTFNF